jgi:iron complex outermembrane receptor protein
MRSVFNNLFASTFWDVQDTLLEDIDRIEVIRGPAATIWGANAVNGVINIITRSARLTQGPLLSAGTGTEERAFGALRYGGEAGPDAHWRGYVKYFQRDDSEGIEGWDAADDWDLLRGGFRLDRKSRSGEELTVQGDAYSGSAGTTGTRFDTASALPRRVEEDTQLSGANLLARWETGAGGVEKMSLQAYYDWTHRDDTLFGEQRHTLDFSLQQSLKPGLRHELIWGLGYRYGLSDLDQSPTIAVSRERRTEHLYSLFLQDEISLLPERLVLTVGARFEHNSYTDEEIHPNLRLLGLLSEHHSLWGAVSRASRTPSRFDREMRILTPVSSAPPVIGILSADPDFASERVTAYEVGYRYHPKAQFSFDATIFYNDYDRLRSFELDPIFLEATPPPVHGVLPGTIDNRLEGRTCGLELAFDWQPTRYLQLDLAYTYLEIDIRHRHLDSDMFARIEEEKSPKHEGSLRAGFDLPGPIELDLWLRYVDHLRRDDIPSYLELDTRLGWNPRPDLELALVGQNLLDSQHQEFIRETLFNSIPTEVERAVYVKTTWRP